MKRQIGIIVGTIFLLNTCIWAQKDSTFRRCYVGSTFFMLGNLNVNDPNRPDFYQLNFGYWLSKKDVISLELKTWKYAWPVGIPYGSSFNAPEEKYPGSVRDYGFALVYQRFIWKGAYAAIHAMNSKQIYTDTLNKKVGEGYQLFLTYRVGYHIKLFKNRFFIEPSIAVTNWPVRTNVPEGFAKKDEKWPIYFLFEPGFHFGFKF